MLRTVIVEDEPMSRLYLINLLTEVFPHVQIVATASTEEEALSAIHHFRPQLVFVDIELPAGSGFGVAMKHTSVGTRIIFTTALDQQAMALLRLSGVAYIQKPIDVDSLSYVLLRPDTECNHTIALDHLRVSLRNDGIPVSMVVAGTETPVYLTLSDIIAIEAAGEGSVIQHAGGGAIVSPYELRELDELLTPYGFFRTHQKHLINLTHVASSPKAGEDKVIARGNISVPLSPKKLDDLRSRLNV